jgi:uncharacterized protein YjbI with pentapeptide repeats
MAAGLRTGAHRRMTPRPRMGRNSFGFQKKVITQKKAITASEKPDTWKEWKAKHPRWRPLWLWIFGWPEWRLERLVYWCKGLAIFEMLEFVGRASVLIAVFLWFWEAGDREKQKHYRAWELINSARGSSGDGGRRDALQDLNADKVDLSAAPLSKAYLVEAQLSNAKLSRADLIKADLSGANLAGANLTGANLTKANLSNSDLTGANLTDTNLTGALLVQAKLIGIYSAGAKLIGTFLTGAFLCDAYLSETDLTGANLAGADLSRTDVSNADLTGADLTDANLTSANLSGTVFCKTTMPDGTVNNRDCPPEPALPDPSETPPAPN